MSISILINNNSFQANKLANYTTQYTGKIYDYQNYLSDYLRLKKINNYLVTSLNGKSIYRVEIDDQFNKVLFVEKIYIGERIRDIKYSKILNSFILALEDSGSLGLLSSPQSIN